MSTGWKGRNKHLTRHCKSTLCCILVFLSSFSILAGKRSGGRLLAAGKPENTITVAFVRGGHFGIEAVEYLLQRALPGFHISFLPASTSAVRDDVDLVVEGPPLFADGSYGPCPPRHIPWLQYIAEPGRHYDDTKWCSHDSAPLVRLDTSLKYIHDVSPDTVFLWTPYGCKAIVELKLQSKLMSLNWRSLGDKLVRNRENLVAWISANCAKHRVDLWNEIVKRADEARGETGLHALGACMHNVDFHIPERSAGWHQTIGAYEKYRFVFALENTYEPGYVSEKLVTAIASGAIPIYFGDGNAASMIFNPDAFIDVLQLWDRQEHTINFSELEKNNWKMVASHVLDINRNTSALDVFSQRAAFPSPYRKSVRHLASFKLPNFPFPPTCFEVGPVSDFDAQTTLAFNAIKATFLMK